MIKQSDLPAIGSAFEGGHFAGQLRIGEQRFALIVAPKALGEHSPIVWNKSSKSVEGAASYYNGMANTIAMAAAGSKLAEWALDLRIDGRDDWYLPSQDELELLYRHFKPTTDENLCYARSGINLSAAPQTYPYTPSLPAQTELEAFRSGGAEAFDAAWYWSSTQPASDSAYAWYQYFGYGVQDYGSKYLELRARAVRRLAL